MSKALFFADSHLRDVGSFPPFNRIDENGLSREVNNILKGFEFLTNLILNEKPIYVASLGDWFHNPESLTTQTLYAGAMAYKSIMNACETVGARFDIIEGNHDIFNEEKGISTVQIFGKNLIKSTQIIKIDETFNVGVIPFMSNTGDFNDNVRYLRDSKVDLILCHQDFQGCRYENNHMSESKLSPKTGVPTIAGDIHLPQQIGDVTYVGSLVQNRFNRTNIKNIGGAIIYDFKTKTMKKHPNTYSKHYVKITDPDQLAELNPERVVLQVTCPIDEEYLDEYEYIKISRPVLPQSKMVKADIETKKPEDMLRSWIQKDRPEALEMYDCVMKGAISNEG